jgi:flagellar protein FliS
MLLDGAIERIVQARGMLGLGDMAGKGQQITKAIAIVNELRGSLDHKVDPSLSGRLESLYEYVTRRLLFGQLNNDAAALDESMQLLTPVRDGWRAIRGEYLAGARAVAGAA